MQVGFPLVGEEFVEAVVWRAGDAGDDVAEIGEGVDAVALGALDEAVVGGGSVAAALAAGEEPVVAFMRRSA